MAESKAELTDRWRRENREEEVARFRQQVRDDSRAKGASKKAAHEHAWSEAARKFPPLPQPKTTSEANAASAHSKPTAKPTLSPLDHPIALFGGKTLRQMNAERRRKWAVAPIVESEMPWSDLPEGSDIDDDEGLDRNWAVKNLLLVMKRIDGDEQHFEIDWGKAVTPPPTTWGMEKVRQMLRNPNDFEWQLQDAADTQYPGDVDGK